MPSGKQKNRKGHNWFIAHGEYFKIFYGLLLVVYLASCSSVDEIPFKGSIIGLPIESTLDSTSAWQLAHEKNAPHPTNHPSIDFQTIKLVRKIYASNLALHSTYREVLRTIKKTSFLEIKRNFKVLFIPGFMYKADITTGADFNQQRTLFTQLSMNHHLIETKENGFVEENAKIVAQTIVKEVNQAQNLILVSASKGGLETAIALAKYLPKSHIENVKAWISIGGIHRGTYLADHGTKFPTSIIAHIVSWIEGFSYNLITDMSVAKNSTLFDSMQLPQDIFYLQFVGVPLTGQVRDLIKSRFYELAQYGPNDGLTTIEHQLIPNAHVIVELGLDHYYKDPQIDAKTLALLVTTLKRITLSPSPNN